MDTCNLLALAIEVSNPRQPPIDFLGISLHLSLQVLVFKHANFKWKTRTFCHHNLLIWPMSHNNVHLLRTGVESEKGRQTHSQLTHNFRGQRSEDNVDSNLTFGPMFKNTTIAPCSVLRQFAKPSSNSVRAGCGLNLKYDCCRLVDYHKIQLSKDLQGGLQSLPELAYMPSQ